MRLTLILFSFVWANEEMVVGSGRGRVTGKRSKSSPDQQVVPFPKREKSGESVGESLRKKYDDVKNEPIPENLQTLIEALREAERKDQAEGD